MNNFKKILETFYRSACEKCGNQKFERLIDMDDDMKDFHQKARCKECGSEYPIRKKKPTSATDKAKYTEVLLSKMGYEKRSS